jgi:hypothetical protein
MDTVKPALVKWIAMASSAILERRGSLPLKKIAIVRVALSFAFASLDTAVLGDVSSLS